MTTTTTPPAVQLAMIADPIDSAFAEFHQANPEVYRQLVQIARQWKAAGRDRIGIATCWEVLRYNAGLAVDGGKGPKLNNNFRANYARLVMANEEDLRGIFEVRALRRSSEYVGGDHDAAAAALDAAIANDAALAAATEPSTTPTTHARESA